MSDNDTKSEQKIGEHQKHKGYGRRQNYNNYGGNGRHTQEDLREKLNRMRQTKSDKPPPPDPPNGFLKDPLRDGERMHVSTPKSTQQYKQTRRNTPKVDLMQPTNIKVEVSTVTGERSCVIDNTKKLPEIKHVPDKKNYYKKHHTKTDGGCNNHQQNRGDKKSYGKKKSGEEPSKDTKSDGEISNTGANENVKCDTQNATN